MIRHIYEKNDNKSLLILGKYGTGTVDRKLINREKRKKREIENTKSAHMHNYLISIYSKLINA